MPAGCATVVGGTRRGSILGPPPPPSEQRRHELAEFLRHHRASVTPDQVGIEANGRRRTPGLRREEVAQLAGVGLSWYTWLEQGRDITPSAQVLDALARALRLDGAERTHLYGLAGVPLAAPAGEYPLEAPPELAAVVEGLEPHPAYLLGPRTDVLAFNRAATRMLMVPRPAPDGRPNLLWTLFTTPELGEQARETARSTLARFRVEHARRMGDPGFAALVAALEEASPEFRAAWAEHHVLTDQLGLKTIAHATLGTLRLHHLQSVPTSHPDLRLTVFTPADETTRAALAASSRRRPEGR